jgi:hypothetical protein
MAHPADMDCLNVSHDCSPGTSQLPSRLGFGVFSPHIVSSLIFSDIIFATQY